jgi:hypothetical protein
MTGLRAGQSGETALIQAGDGVLTMRFTRAEFFALARVPTSPEPM